MSLDELHETLHRANVSAAESGSIHSQMLKHSPVPSLAVLLEIFKEIWQSGKFPRIWSTATVITILKPHLTVFGPFLSLFTYAIRLNDLSIAAYELSAAS